MQMLIAGAGASKGREAREGHKKYQSMRLNWIEFRVRTIANRFLLSLSEGKKQKQKQ